MVGAKYVSGTRASGIVSSAADVQWMSVVHGMRGVGGVCVFGSGRRGWRVDESIGFVFYQSCGNRSRVGRVSVLRWCWWGVGMGLGWVVLCLCEL